MKFADYFKLPYPASKIGNRFGVHDIENGHDVYGPQGHRGVDFTVGANAAIPVIANGIVEKVMWSDALGNVTVVRHYLHGENNDLYSGYCHQSSQQVKVGQAVTLGQTIGHTGATGTAAYGPHLHLTLSHDVMGVEWGEVMDPIAYIDAHDTPPHLPAAPAPTPLFTPARRGEGLWAIGQRVGVSLPTMKRLNPDVKPPTYLILLGQRIRYR